MLTPFRNEPYVDFAQPAPQAAMQEALRLVASQVGRHYPLVIGGREITTEQSIVSTNPACPSQVVGSVSAADTDLAQKAIDAAWQAFPDWRRTPPEVRARYLLKTAAILRRRIFEFSAWLTVEVSKSWPEAYADTAEAIDFLEFYAREMMRLGRSHATTPYPGEENEVVYLPLGAGVAISPWNFPLAIMAGMTVAAVVTGNTVITKPASQAPVVAAKFHEVLREASLPDGVANFLPGPGGLMGDALTDNPRTRFISFTGSKEIGIRIFERAAKVHPGQRWLKRTILEMGGKDAMVVDADADLDEAAAAVVAASFGYQGQKCSACSRLIAHTAIYDGLLERVVDRASTLKVGNPSDGGYDLGAVIDAAARRKIEEYIGIGAVEGRIVLGGTPHANSEGHFVAPTIVADVAPDARLAQEEVFGPVLAVIRADSFEHAIEIANSTEFGLTGGAMSGSRAHLELARREFHVGNLYLNRKCTGALVDVQPFGGFNMSGTDSKAGGRDYLQLFMQAKSISERL